METTKHCRACNQILPLEEFTKSRQTQSGIYPYCKVCNRSKVAAYRKLMSSRPKHEVQVPAEKFCPNCDTTKPSSEFWPDSSKRDGLHNICKICKGVAQKKTYIKTVQPRLQAIYAARYGITIEQFNSMYSAQDSRCWICRREFGSHRKPKIDHCHATGKVRGILCQSCNMAIGIFSDSTERLHRAIEYLSR